MNEKPEVEQVENPCIVPIGWNIYQRINWVRSQISYIQKDSAVQGYKAVRHDAVTAHVRPLLVQAGVIVMQSLKSAQTVDSGSTTKNGVPIIRYEAIYTISFVNSERPDEKVICDYSAHALDQGDKAPGKAMSYGMKFCYLKTFAIETGEDEESRIEQKAQAEIQAEQENYRLRQLNETRNRLLDSITVIKESMREGDLSTAAEAWFEIDDADKKILWVAPTKGGPFTTDERKTIKSTEFREAHFGAE